MYVYYRKLGQTTPQETVIIIGILDFSKDFELQYGLDSIKNLKTPISWYLKLLNITLIILSKLKPLSLFSISIILTSKLICSSIVSYKFLYLSDSAKDDTSSPSSRTSFTLFSHFHLKV